MSIDLTDLIFNDEAAAWTHFEAIRWPAEAEFDFHYNNRSGLGVEDTERARRAVEGAVGKRLTYHQRHLSLPKKKLWEPTR